MTTDTQKRQTLSSVAAVFSAFFVFLLGGGVVLKVWVDQRDSTRQPIGAPSQVEKSQIEPVDRANTTEDLPEVVPSKKPPAPSKKPKKRTSASSGENAKPAPPPKRDDTERPRTGKGTVMVMGSASRVRLMGSAGTFGPGTVPAGSYTIQATFSGSDPRMAGTVEIDGDERIIVVCSSSTQKCVQQ